MLISKAENETSRYNMIYNFAIARTYLSIIGGFFNNLQLILLKYTQQNYTNDTYFIPASKAAPHRGQVQQTSDLHIFTTVLSNKTLSMMGHIDSTMVVHVVA